MPKSDNESRSKPDLAKVDLVLQYALLISGEQDDNFDRQLGPIHLLKYVYLADLAYAQKHSGLTYTGIRWQFYKFGPWSQAVHDRIEPALHAIGAEKKSFQSTYEERKNWVRWSVRNAAMLREKGRELPANITIQLRTNVREFGKDTARLLHYVYSTVPMRTAAPHEDLNFAVAVDAPEDDFGAPSLRMHKLSNKARKRLRQRLLALRQKRGRENPDKEPLARSAVEPLHDAVYDDGLAWLNSLAGQELSERKIVVEFSDEVWKSDSRKGEDVS